MEVVVEIANKSDEEVEVGIVSWNDMEVAV